MLEEEKIRKLINKAFKGYKFRQQIMQDVYNAGLSRHGCQILDMLMLGRAFPRIKRVLLWGDAAWEKRIEELYKFLYNFSPQKNAFLKIFK
jgi:hypothetical protein